MKTSSALDTDVEGALSEPRVSVQSNDSVSEALLQYLWSGQLSAAQPFGDRTVSKAEHMFEQDQREPWGATVAGYYLLRIGAYERLHNWPSVFADNMPWLPDSSIIHAWQILLDPALNDYRLARNRLLDAERAGIPVCTEGVRLLYDGLRLFANESTDARNAAERVARYLRAMNSRSPFCEFFGHDPATPNPCLAPDERKLYRGATRLFTQITPSEALLDFSHIGDIREVLSIKKLESTAPRQLPKAVDEIERSEIRGSAES